MAEPIQREPEVNDGFDAIFKHLTGVDNLSAKRDEAIRNDMCIQPPFGCGSDAKYFDNEQAQREYTITGMCQLCQIRFVEEHKEQ